MYASDYSLIGSLNRLTQDLLNKVPIYCIASAIFPLYLTTSQVPAAFPKPDFFWTPVAPPEKGNEQLSGPLQSVSHHGV